MDCPKCGYAGAAGDECPRCGVIFSKFRPAPEAEESPLSVEFQPPPELPPPPELSAPELPPPPPAESIQPPTFPSIVSPGRPIVFGEILGETFTVYFSDFLTFFVLTSISYLPLLAFSLIQPKTPREATVHLVATLALSLICNALATAALVFGVLQHLRRRTTSVLECLQKGLGSVLLVVGVSLLQGLLTALGLVLCIVPGFIALATFAVAIPVTVEERPGVFDALNRSTALTQGSRWTTFGVLAGLGLLGVAFGKVIGLAYGLLVAGSKIGIDFTTQQVLGTLAGVIPAGLSGTAATILYYRLRSAKESIDVEDLVSVFD